MRTTLRKAIGAAIGTAATSLGVALSDGALSTPELLGAGGGTLLTFGAVWKLAFSVPAD